MEDYLKRSQAFQKRLGIQPLSRREARYLMFRMACPLMQHKLQRFTDLNFVPKTFLHGNPHLDNYVRTDRGSAMMDFDRSRIGPYCWDIIRFLSSLSLRRDEGDGYLDRKVIDYFIDGYIVHYLNPEIPPKQIKLLKGAQPEKWQTSTIEYLKSNKRWARKMREHRLPPSHPLATTLLQKFLESQDQASVLKEFKIQEIGFTPGSLGKKHFIFALAPKDVDSRKDAILIDIKEVYAEKNTKFFYSPYEHHGVRMIEASKIYAPGMEELQGYCTVENRQYWGRQVPSFAVKVKKFLDKNEQCDVAYSVGSELGKGHRKGLLDPKASDFLYKDFQQNFDKYYKISKLFTYELNLAFETTMRKIELYQNYRSW